MIVVSFALRESAPPESTLAFSPALGSDSGVVVLFVCHLTT